MENETIFIERVKEYSQELHNALNSLLGQLNSNLAPLEEKLLKDTLSCDATYLFIASSKEKKIVGTVTLVIFFALSGRRARIEDIVVDESYRGKGIGGLLMKKVLDVAKQQNIEKIDLTSNPKRGVSKLYESFGFLKKDTELFRLILSTKK